MSRFTAIHTGSFNLLQEESHIDCSRSYIYHNTALWWEEASPRSVPFTFCELKQVNMTETIWYIEPADISVATGVAEGTIRNSYKDLYPHLAKIIPAWYAKEEDLKNLQSPWVSVCFSPLVAAMHAFEFRLGYIFIWSRNATRATLRQEFYSRYVSNILHKIP